MEWDKPIGELYNQLISAAAKPSYTHLPAAPPLLIGDESPSSKTF